MFLNAISRYSTIIETLAYFGEYGNTEVYPMVIMVMSVSPRWYIKTFMWLTVAGHIM